MKTARNEQIISTVTTAERDAIDAYADHHGLSRAEVIRRGTLALVNPDGLPVPDARSAAIAADQAKIRELSAILRRRL